MGILGSLKNCRKINLINLFFRFLQFVDGLVVIGLYATDLHRANQLHKYSDGKWVYAVIVGTIAAVSALAYTLTGIVIQYRAVAVLFIWDWIVTIFWAALLGIFATMYLHERAEMDGGIKRMKIAVVFDFIGLALWFITACLGTWWFVTERQGRVHAARGKD